MAAYYRLVEHLGWGEGIYNHIASRVPDSPHEFLIEPHALTYEEVTASKLIKVDSRADLDDTSGVNKVGFTTHACEVQLAAEATDQGVIEIPPDVCRKAVEQFKRHDSGRGGADWPAWLRRIERIDPSFKN